MDMKKKVCFIVFQYIYGNQKANMNFKEIVNYTQHHNISINKNEILISGRLCKDIILGDILFTENNTKIIVKGLFAYGHTFEQLNAGMTCAILANMAKAEHSFSMYELLYIMSDDCIKNEVLQ